MTRPWSTEAYVRGWALRVRDAWGTAAAGEDSLKFWRDRWAEAHPDAGKRRRGIQDEDAHDARLAAIERGEAKY